ncbi:MAG: hypothetical protein HQL04_07310 [Nitrospirae bacterium]|nr:hypothetical protein [Nitrospirota bacterium]
MDREITDTETVEERVLSLHTREATKDQEEAGNKCPTQSKKYTASIYSAPNANLPPEFADAISELEKNIDMRVFLLIQNVGKKFASLDDNLLPAFLEHLNDFPCKKIALLIDSPGGFASDTYKIAAFFKNQCSGYIAIVPRYAKSAATLLTLGADSILLGRHAELGPLDAQYNDPERETYLSALDELQALERLHVFALDAADRTMLMLLARTGKKLDTLLPITLRFAADMVRPLFENIDVVHYTQMSRILRVAEEYAIRLLQNRYSEEIARKIARHLVEEYPEHGFVIDMAEAAKIDTDLVTSLLEDQQSIVDRILKHLTQLTAIGFLKEVSNE